MGNTLNIAILMGESPNNERFRKANGAGGGGGPTLFIMPPGEYCVSERIRIENKNGGGWGEMASFRRFRSFKEKFHKIINTWYSR